MAQSFNDRYSGLKLISKSGFASVYLAYDILMRSKVVLKLIKDHTKAKFVEQEIERLKDLQCVYIVRYYGLIDYGDRKGYSMEYYPNGSVGQFIRNKKAPEQVICGVMSCVLLALNYLHNLNIAHRDIKPDNMLFTNGGVLLADFGISDRSQTLAASHEGCGTLYYLAPERFEGKEELKSDVWALGISLLEMALGKNPFEGLSPQEVKERVLRGALPSLSSSKWSTECIDFCSACLKRDVTQRASVSKLLSHPFVRDTVEAFQNNNRLDAIASLFSHDSPSPVGGTEEPAQQSEMNILLETMVNPLFEQDSPSPVGGTEEPAQQSEMNILLETVVNPFFSHDSQSPVGGTEEPSRQSDVNILLETVVNPFFEQDRDVLQLNDGFGNAPSFTKWEVAASQKLRSLTIGNSCLPYVGRLELRDFPSLEDVVIGEKCFTRSRGELFIMHCPKLNGVRIGSESCPMWKKLQIQACHALLSLETGESCFRDCDALHLTDVPCLERLTIGSQGFNGSALKHVAFEALSSLQRLCVGDRCFKNVEKVQLLGLDELEKVEVGQGSFTRYELDTPGKSDANRQFFLKNCPRVRELKIGRCSFSDYDVCVIANVHALEVVEMGEMDKTSFSFQYASLQLRGLPSLKSLLLGKRSFQYCVYFTLEDLPTLSHLQFGMNAVQFRPNDVSSVFTMSNLPSLTSLTLATTRGNCTFKYPHRVVLQSFSKLRDVVGIPTLFSTSHSVVQKRVGAMENYLPKSAM